MTESSSLADVIGNRASAPMQEEPEESKSEAPVVNPAELNDIAQGEFRIEAIRMKDAEQGQVLWENNEWDLTSNEEQKVEFPATMLSCRAIGREIVFYSKKIMHQFAIRQVMSMQGQVIEEFGFDFGFVMPNTTNSWEQVIDADVGQVMPAEVLSGNLVVDTYFYAKGVQFAQQRYRIYYV